MARQLYSTGSSWEPRIGCSRAVHSGDWLAISACGPLAPDGVSTAAPDAYGQAKRCLEIIAGVVTKAGFSLGDVVKTRVYFRSREHFEEIARAHGEMFSSIRPANAFIRVVGFASDEWHVEIEADCHRTSGG
jgi:enamine deaminase RidA (YjgF/YER057c/UK114 family)